MNKYFSIKAKLLNIFSVVILFLLFAMLFSSIYIIKNKFDSVSQDLESQVNTLYNEINETVENTNEEIKNTKENEIKIFLETSAKICDHLIRVEMENLSRKIKIISEKENIQNAIAFNLFKHKSIQQTNKTYYSQNYIKSNKPLKFISLLNSEKTLAWPGREIRAGLELFGKHGVIKARTDIKDEFKEKDNSQHIQDILNSNVYLEISKLLSTEIGLAIKVYSRIRNNKTQEIVGGLIALIPIDNTFADYIKKHTGCEVVIYKNNGDFYSTSFFVDGNRFKFKNKPIIFEELYNNPNKIIFEDIIMPSPKFPNKKNHIYKFIFYPILGENESLIGLIGLGTNTDSFRNILKTLEKDKNSTFNKFNNTKLSLVKSINKSGNTMLKEFIYIIVIIMTLGVVISVLIFDTILSKFILLTIKKLSKNLKALSEGKSTLKHIKVSSNDEIGQLTTYFNKFIENLKYVIGKIVDSSQIISDASKNINSENNKFIESAVNQSIAIDNTSKQIENINDVIQKHNLKVLDINKIKGDLIFNFEKIKSYNELLNSISLKSNDLLEEKTNYSEKNLESLKILLGQFINYSEKILREINNSEKKYQSLELFVSELSFSVEAQSKEINLILSIIQNLDELNKNNINIAQDISLRTKTLHKKAQEFNDIIEHLVLQQYFHSKK